MCVADRAYVGCPLGFAQNPRLLRKHFPLAKIVVCARDPTAAFPSFVDLLGALTKTQFDPVFSMRMTTLYQVYSSKVYKALAEFPGDEHTL